MKQFINVTAGDFRLRYGSPPIDAGVRLSEVVRERDGVARPQADAHDIEAYER
jgi:hypothetical protein